MHMRQLLISCSNSYLGGGIPALARASFRIAIGRFAEEEASIASSKADETSTISWSLLGT
jgi:hypothetical protein